MKLYPLNLAVQEAPVDPFVPDGPQKYRVVVYEGTPGLLPCDDCDTVVLTGEYLSSSEALVAFANGVQDVLDVLEDHQRLLGALGAAIDGAREKTAEAVAAHEGRFQHRPVKW